MFSASDFFSREALAGYDREVLETSVITLVGCGAAGNNIALNLALAGVGEIRLIDFDVVEPSNLTRSPLFRRERLAGSRTRTKARELALGVLSTSYATRPVVRFAAKKVEELGLGALAGSAAIVSAVDSFAVRAYLSNVSRLLGIPLVEVGFSAPRGQVSVFPNRTNEEACWRCMHPHVQHGSFSSCPLYARAVVAEGRVPATQTVAAVFGALAAEAAIEAVHGHFSLGGKALHFDVRNGRSRIVELTPDPYCPGVHRLFAAPKKLDVPVTAPLTEVFRALTGFQEPVIELPAPFVVEAPCADCGHAVKMGKPAWALATPPRCATCPDSPRSSAASVLHRMRAGDPDSRRTCRGLWLAPGAILEVEDSTTAERHAVQLAGSVSDLFTTLERSVPEPILNEINSGNAPVTAEAQNA